MGIWEETCYYKIIIAFFSQSIMIWYGTPRSGKLCLDKAGEDLKTILEGLEVVWRMGVRKWRICLEL